ncbi:hypothetical protein [Pseudomonas shirazensis]
MNSIERIIELNFKLSSHRLIYNYYTRKRKIIACFFLLFLIVQICLLTYFLKNYEFWLLFSFLSVIPILIIFGNFIKKWSIEIIESKYSYVFCENDKRKFNDSILKDIQKNEFKKLVRSYIVLDKENILFLIDCIKRENENNFLVNSIMTGFFTFIITIYLGGFLGGFANFTDKVDEYLQFFKIIGIFSTAFYLIVVSIYFFGLRDFILFRIRKENRLIRILENIYLEQCCAS